MTQQANKMAVEEKQESQNPTTEENISPPSELAEPRWSVVTFETVAVSNLTYNEAVRWLEELRKQKVSGLCVITDEAAARFAK